MKLILISLLVLLSTSSFAETQRLEGSEAKALYISLPKVLVYSAPGALIKEAAELSCSAMAAGPGNTGYRCLVKNLTMNDLVLENREAEALYASLPEELKYSAPGALVKEATEFSCSAMAAGPSNTKYVCSFKSRDVMSQKMLQKNQSACYCARFVDRGNGHTMWALMKSVSSRVETRITGFTSDYSWCLQMLYANSQC